MTRRKRAVVVALSIIVPALVLGSWQGLTYAFRHAYSIGMRTGVVRKISVKGSLVCKSVEGELALQGAVVGTKPDIWQFSLDSDSDDSPLLKELRAAERSGERVTLHYRQDKHLWWRCNPAEYYVTSVEK